MRILPEDAQDALFVHVAEIEHIPDPGIHSGENAINFPHNLELLEEDPECVSAMQVPWRGGTPRLRVAEIQHPIGRAFANRAWQRS